MKLTSRPPKYTENTQALLRSGGVPCCTDGMTVLDLFSGIGGFSLGLERAGMRTIAFCEQDAKCRRVLREHWPDVPIFGDIRKLHAKDLPESPDVIVGGWPCQDISKAGCGKGLAGERSSLWAELHRLIDEIRPKLFIGENACALRGNGLTQVMQDLWEVGYDAEWHIMPASWFADHKRERVWIIANPNSGGRETPWITQSVVEMAWRKTYEQLQAEEPGGSSGREGRFFEPGVGRILPDDVPGRMDRLSCYGNAVIPQIPELIGRAIAECG